jgi:hypothetical protein
MSIFESDVLKPREPTLPADDWAEFTLRDVSVVYGNNARQASLLAAYADCPLTVRGRLQAPERGYAHHRTSSARSDCLIPVLRLLQYSKNHTNPPISQFKMSPASHTLRWTMEPTLSGPWEKQGGSPLQGRQRTTKVHMTQTYRLWNFYTS